jgi:FtsZ-binding cell division protein ZapB
MSILDFIPKTAAIVVGLTVLGGAIVGAIRLMKWIVKKTEDLNKAIIDSTQIANVKLSIDALEEKINTLLKEFKPNGGGSLKDAVNRLETETSHILVQMAFNKVAVESHVNNYGLINKSGFVKTDTEGNTIEVGTSVCRLLQRNFEELKDKNYVNYIYPSERDGWIKGITNALNTKSDFEIEVRIALPNVGKAAKKYIKINNTGKRMEVAGVFVGYYIVVTQID